MSNVAVRYIEDRPYVITDEPVEGFKTKDKYHYAPLDHESRAKVVSITGTNVPLMANYPWPAPPGITPYKHQRITAEFCVNRMRCWVLNGMRSGKSLACAWGLDFLFRIGSVKRALILAPLTILEDVWQSELFNVMPQRNVYVANESIDDFIHAMKYSSYDIIVCNHDKIKFATKTIDEWAPDLVVVDEAGGFRYWNTDRTKALTAIMQEPSRGLWALTATPTPQGPTDVWPLARLISPHKVPKSFRRFRDSVINQCPFTRRVTVRPEAETIVRAALDPAIRYRTKDCIELPPMAHIRRPVDLTPAQKTNIKDLQKKAVTILKDLDSGEDSQVVAANGAVVASKVLQVLGGAVIDNKGKTNVVGADRRIKEVINILDELGHDQKLVLMCTFKGIQKYIQTKLSKRQITSAIINGSMPGGERTKVLKSFRTEDVRVLIAHPECIRFGVNLAVSNNLCWYLPSYKSEDWQQGNERITGPKSALKQGTNIIRLSTGSIEDRLYDRLMNQEAAQESIVSVMNAIAS